jgi:hypothetical protein
MAGVQGSCPSCSNPIVAPHPEPGPPAPQAAPAASSTQSGQPEISAPAPRANEFHAPLPDPSSPLSDQSPPPTPSPAPFPTNNPIPDLQEATPLPASPSARESFPPPAQSDLQVPAPVSAALQEQPGNSLPTPEPDPLPRRQVVPDPFSGPAPTQPGPAPAQPYQSAPAPGDPFGSSPTSGAPDLDFGGSTTGGFPLPQAPNPIPDPAPAPPAPDPLGGSALGSLELDLASGAAAEPAPVADPLGPPPPLTPGGLPPAEIPTDPLADSLLSLGNFPTTPEPFTPPTPEPNPGMAPFPDLDSPSLPDLTAPSSTAQSHPTFGGGDSSPPFASPAPTPEATNLPPGLASPPNPSGELNPQNTLPLSQSDPIPSSISPLREPVSKNVQPAPPRRRLRWPGIVFPLLFLVLAAIMIYLVLDLSELLPHSQTYRQLPTVPEGPHQPPALKVADSNPSNSEIANANLNLPPSPPKLVPQPSVDNPLPVLPPTLEDSKKPLIEDRDRSVKGEVGLPPLINLNKSSGLIQPKSSLPSKPAGVLRKFLTATSLAERRAYMTPSRRSETELATGPLSKALPEVVRQYSNPYMKDSSEKHTEYFFEVSFNHTPDETPVPIMVQLKEWGDGKIKIHTDAFLDLYNDEMAIFGLKPVPGERTFHVIADAYKRCYDDGIPEPGKKSFLKLRQHQDLTPRLKAYFASKSPLADQIAQPKALPWGLSGVCTVTVKWNTNTPNQPYVELVRINGFTWNP